MAWTTTTTTTSMWTTTISNPDDNTANTYRIVTSKGAHGVASVTISKTSGSGDSVSPTDNQISQFHEAVVAVVNGSKGKGVAL